MKKFCKSRLQNLKIIIDFVEPKNWISNFKSKISTLKKNGISILFSNRVSILFFLNQNFDADFLSSLFLDQFSARISAPKFFIHDFYFNMCGKKANK